MLLAAALWGLNPVALFYAVDVLDVTPALALFLWGMVLLARPDESRAQNPFIPALGSGDGISVYGTGELMARPNLVEIDLNVSGKAELTGDTPSAWRRASNPFKTTKRRSA